MVLDIMLIDEMGNGRWVVDGFLAAAVDRAVDEESHALLERLVYQCDALTSLVVVFGVGNLRGRVSSVALEGV